ncbi:hypothetical protein GLYMA_14G109401v4 [Glycine max]|nr:hypothetical protein GLYMA_14G109401v4 [Glycine max]KAH1094052.1 hypothetical protein GYH30_039675 [Glycine max]
MEKASFSLLTMLMWTVLMFGNVKSLHSCPETSVSTFIYYFY